MSFLLSQLELNCSTAWRQKPSWWYTAIISSSLGNQIRQLSNLSKSLQSVRTEFKAMSLYCNARFWPANASANNVLRKAHYGNTARDTQGTGKEGRVIWSHQMEGRRQIPYVFRAMQHPDLWVGQEWKGLQPTPPPIGLLKQRFSTYRSDPFRGWMTLSQRFIPDILHMRYLHYNS
jgi:hypothetical protein